MTDVVRITDLREPVLDDAQRAAVEYAASLDITFDADQIVRAARDRTGLTDLGDDGPEGAGLLDRLGLMIRAIDDDSGLGPLGRMILHQRTVRLLSNRLLVEDLIRRTPEILDIRLEAPIIVIGLPRSGTTHLVNLLAADRRLRSLPYWESLEPVPNRGDGPGRDGVDPRYDRCRRSYEAQMAIAPLVRAMHHQEPSAIEEEIELQDLDLGSYNLEWQARVPAWRDAYLEFDQVRSYGYLHRVLQVLTHLRGPRRWVLKSPQHLEQIGPLLATFPDATVAVTHRDPVAVIQSAATMLAYGDRIRRPAVQADELGAYWVDRVERLLRACVRDHHLLDPDRTVDVMFHDFMADDLATVGRIYERSELDFDDRTRARVEHHLAEHGRGAHGRVVYDLRGDFGLDPDRVRERFDFYFDRFPVRAEEI